MTIPEILPAVHAYLAKHPTGGSLHIVLDDANVEDRHLQFCVRSAQEHGDLEGATLAVQLLQLSKTQRSKLARVCWRAS